MFKKGDKLKYVELFVEDTPHKHNIYCGTRLGDVLTVEYINKHNCVKFVEFGGYHSDIERCFKKVSGKFEERKRRMCSV